MPYKSEAQRKFFHANKAKLESQGVNVSEWDRASIGRRLPTKVKSKMKNVITKKPADKFQPKKIKSGKAMLGKAMKKLAKKK